MNIEVYKMLRKCFSSLVRYSVCIFLEYFPSRQPNLILFVFTNYNYNFKIKLQTTEFYVVGYIYTCLQLSYFFGHDINFEGSLQIVGIKLRDVVLSLKQLQVENK